MEQFNFILQTLISILSGILVITPLLIKLIQYVKLSVKEKNWTNLLEILMSLMAEAEEKFEKGADKKEWVMGELEAISDSLNYDIDWDVVSTMIDSLCGLAKSLNK